MNKWETLADEKIIERTVEALKANGIEALVFENGEEARKKVSEIIPEGAEVMTMSSVTLDATGISGLLESGNYNSVMKRLMSMNRTTQGLEMQKLGAAPGWSVGSVHAVTEDGKVLIASNSGSQLPAYAYTSSHVIWIVGTNKIVRDVDEGIKRIYEHTLPLESERARKAYGVPGSAVNKLLIMNKENIPGRIMMILVKEKLGF